MGGDVGNSNAILGGWRWVVLPGGGGLVWESCQFLKPSGSISRFSGGA
ncbi:MAG: hypothetical protein HQL95_00680 [Magnetococcales bacterium]|nr:hypothetical protein [Magnetococcales bacterium]